ncbi:autotransporter-associated N-terminal domain-containing protein [Leptotrichia sp. oral taxon 223]|uniref:autotransporter-associated N-terminal domain-containing protein n=1 Tax=Leptotrichia sp. oral taxon 223 TaxID=712363 RepID=UPI0015BA6AF9|nr:autotransporter-associated N-terminal domain-containing protein [Leptotrichia sp. oral taxon 223]NWO18093.1 autotransporter-associated N-terminal domain-containing protein [Leptotrichia sp. oral taxon 223]
MTNNLRKVSQDLRAFAKRTKDFKYTDSALITFLMTGVVSITSNLFSAPTDKSIENQKQEISSSIKGMHQKVRETRRENNKLLKDTNLELIQLMEQGDHVVKSPWSSWQFGMNYMYNDWHGHYKGRGDKEEKYPYEGIFERSSNVYERTVSPDSDKYSLLSKTRGLKSATGSAGNYGIASTKVVKEPIVGFEVNAGITPRQVQKGAITIPAKQATTPQTPTPVNFSPVAPNVPTINTVPVNITAVALTPFWNSNRQTKLGKNFSINDNNTYTLNTGDLGLCSPSCPSGENAAHAILEITDTGEYSIGKNVTFVVNATGERALSFDPIENTKSLNYSKFTNNGKIILNATNTAGMELTTQENGINVTGINNGTINGELDRQSAFTFTQEQNPTGTYTAINETGGTISLTGNTSTGFGFYVKSPGWVVKAINKGNVTMAGNTSYGIGLSTKATLPGGGTANNNVAAGSVFQNASGGIMNISGDNSGGIAVQKQADPSRALTVENSGGGTINVSGENSFGMYSELHQNVTNAGDINITGSKNNSIGLRNNNIDNDANSSMTNTGNINISSTGNTNIGLYTSNGTVINTGKVNVTAGKNVGMVVYGTGKGKNESGAEINVTSSDVSQGVVTKGTGSFTNKGKITLNSAGNGSVGVIVGNATPMESGTLDSTNGEIDITVTGNKSIGTFSNGNLTLGKTNVVANDGAVNFFEGKNTSSTTTFATGKNSTAKTGQGSLLFYSDGGKFNIAGKLTADVAGGSDVNSRGTAFYYTAPSHYASFNSGDITTWANSIFNGSLKNLTLNMDKGSRLFVASDVGMNLSDTTGDSVSKATGANIQGTGYKTFMLYKSKLTINQNVNLDDDNDALNQLEIANSSIDNNNSQTITGTKTGLVALAQENKAHTNRADVTINNYGTVNLSGAKSTGMYAKYGILNNDTTGKITMGDSSTAIYGKDDSIVTNKGVVTIGSNSTGLYSEDTDQAITNDGTITSSGNNSIGVSYKPKAISAAGTDMLKNTGTITMTGDKNVGLYATEGAAATYNVLNAGTITMGDSASLSNPNVAIYTDNANHTLTNGGTVTVGKNSIGLYGYTSDNSGNVTVGNGGIGIYSQGGNVNLTGGTITTGSNEAVGVYTVGSGQNITNNGTTFNLGDNSFGFVNVGSGNTITSTISNIGLGNNSVYVYSNDTKGTVTNNTAISSTGNQNYGLYSAGTVNNNATINLSNGKGNVGIYSVGGGTATNNSSIIVGESDSKNNLFSMRQTILR